MNRVLLAGATGYLGRFITKELLTRNFETRIVVRNKAKVNIKASNLEIIEAQVTEPESLKDICKDIDVVINNRFFNKLFVKKQAILK